MIHRPAAFAVDDRERLVSFIGQHPFASGPRRRRLDDRGPLTPFHIEVKPAFVDIAMLDV